MPELEVPPDDGEVIAYMRKVAGMHTWDSMPMLFMTGWENEELGATTVVAMDLEQHEIPTAIMYFAAEAMSKGERPYVFLYTFEGWMIQVGPGMSAEERAEIDRQTEERQLHARDDAVEQYIMHAVTIDGRNFTGTKGRDTEVSVHTSATTEADGELVAALQSSATIAGRVRRGEV